MILKVGKYYENARALHKNPQWVKDNLDCKVYSECSVMHPEFLIKYFQGVEHCNYANAFGKFYFIEDVVLLPGKRCRIVCMEDVLMSYSSQLESLNVNVIRSENKRQKYIYDPEMQPLVTTGITIKKFSQEPFVAEDFSYLLTVLGGGDRTPVEE